MKCTYCGNELDDEETANPEKDEDGDVMCDQCYDENFRDYCDRCGEKVEKTGLGSEPGHLIAVWVETQGNPEDLKPGYYRVKEWPFYADGMIEGYMISHNLERVADLDDRGKKAAPEVYTNCAPLCSMCRAEVESTLKTPNAEVTGAPHHETNKE